MLSGMVVSWYVRKDPKILGVLAPAAFLVEIGKVLISQYVINENLTESFAKAIEDEGVQAAEQTIVGATTAEVSGALFSHWKFESDLIDVVQNCDTPEKADPKNRKAAQSLHVIRTIVGLHCQITEQNLQEAKELIAAYGLDEESFEQMIQQIQGIE